MKRVSFLGTSAALALAGCGGGHALQSLPLVAARTRSSAENAARLDDAVAAAVDGRTDIAGAVRATAARLSDGESRSVLALNDASIRAFNPKWQGSAAGDDLRLNAANVLVANSITRDQAREIARRELAAGG